MKFPKSNSKSIIQQKLLAFIGIIAIAAIISVYFSVQHTLSAQAEILDREAMTESIEQDVQQEVDEDFDNNSNSEDTLTNTGNNVEVEKKDESTTETTVENNNEATVNQEVTATANTGHNEASRNISIGGNAGIIRTGDASVETTGAVQANNNTTKISDAGNGGSSGGSQVTNTGDDSSFAQNKTSNTTTQVSNDNHATIHQGADATANTGNNIADRNISIGGTAGQIITGAASTKTSYLTTANQSVMLIGGKSNGKGPGSGATIITTGDRHSTNIASNTHRSTKVTNTNNAYVSQQATVVADTGHNDASRNIAKDGGDAGVIKTEDARADVKLLALVNNTYTKVNNGGSAGYYDPLNIINTGDDSSFKSDTNTTTNTEVKNNNTAVVDQNVNAYANTGYNTANRNISFGGNAGVIETGDAEVKVCMVAQVNESKTKISQATPKPQPSPSPTATPKPSPTPKPTATPTPTPTPSPTPTITPKPGDNGENGHDNGDEKPENGEEHDNGEGEEPQNEVTENPVNDTFERFIGGIGPGQVLAASDVAPETFADTGISINWLGLLKTLIVLMIGYTLGSVRQVLVRGRN